MKAVNTRAQSTACHESFGAGSPLRPDETDRTRSRISSWNPGGSQRALRKEVDLNFDLKAARIRYPSHRGGRPAEVLQDMLPYIDDEIGASKIFDLIECPPPSTLLVWTRHAAFGGKGTNLMNIAGAVADPKSAATLPLPLGAATRRLDAVKRSLGGL